MGSTWFCILRFVIYQHQLFRYLSLTIYHHIGPIFPSRYTKPKNNILSNSTINYPKNKKISIFIGTWNVNGRNGSNLNLDDWLVPPEGQPPADMYVLG